MAHAIEAQNLRKSFRMHEAVRGVDLSIRQGELFALLGPNGAGKTTTIHMLTTLLRPDAGSLWKAPTRFASALASRANTPRWTKH